MFNPPRSSIRVIRRLSRASMASKQSLRIIRENVSYSTKPSRHMPALCNARRKLKQKPSTLGLCGNGDCSSRRFTKISKKGSIPEKGAGFVVCNNLRTTEQAILKWGQAVICYFLSGMSLDRRFGQVLLGEGQGNLHSAERGRFDCSSGRGKAQGAVIRRINQENLMLGLSGGHARTRNRIFRDSELLHKDGRMMSERSLSPESKRPRPRGWLARAESRARELRV